MHDPCRHRPFLQESELKRINDARAGELDYVKATNTLDITKAKEMAQIETAKFQNMVTTLGAENIAKIATSGHDNQVCSIDMIDVMTNSLSFIFGHSSSSV